ncbi:MAG: hypothetical protein ACPGJV_06180 [Bacteriovoracaceae bacterium]
MKIAKSFFLFIALFVLSIPTSLWALTDEENEIVANLDFYLEYEVLERDDFDEILVSEEKIKEENSEGAKGLKDEN